MRFFNKDPKIVLPDFDSVDGKARVNLVIYANHKCRLDPKKTRQSVIKKMKVGDQVAIRYEHGKFLVIDARTGLDVGALSPGVQEYLLENYSKNTVFTGRATEIGRFGLDEHDSVQVKYKPL